MSSSSINSLPILAVGEHEGLPEGGFFLLCGFHAAPGPCSQPLHHTSIRQSHPGQFSDQRKYADLKSRYLST